MLAEAVASLPGLSVELDRVMTNMVYVDVIGGVSAGDWVDALAKEGVVLTALGPSLLRAVTHLDVDDEGLSRAIEGFKTVSGQQG